MSAGLFNQKCYIPLYLMDNIDLAQECGKINGYIFAMIITIVLLLCTCYIVYIYNKQSLKDESKKNYVKYYNMTSLKICIGSIICLLLFFWLLYPMIDSKLNGIYWKGYQEKLGAYKSFGFDTKHAINSIEAMKRANIQTNAISSGATNIALATLLARR